MELGLRWRLLGSLQVLREGDETEEAGLCVRIGCTRRALQHLTHRLAFMLALASGGLVHGR